IRLVRLAFVASAIAVALAGCAHAPPPVGHEDASRWSSPKEWLCLPGREDVCARNLDATELAPDGSQPIVHDTRAPGADRVDCLYVYPRADLNLVPGNHTDFSDIEPMARATVAQAAHFRNVCSLYVPLYRQVRLGTYLRSAEEKKKYTDVAIADVEGAFRYY